MPELAAIDAAGPLLPHAGETVAPETAKLIEAGISENTRKSYRRVAAAFSAWCRDHGRQMLPTNSTTLADYVTHLCTVENKAPSTVQQALGIISALNQSAGLPPLGKEVTQDARLALRGHRKTRTAGDREGQAPPIPRDRLQAMVKACPATLAGQRDAVALVIGWSLAMRESELAALDIPDVAITDDGLTVFIKGSKTDKDYLGVHRDIPRSQETTTDPVTLVRVYLATLAERGADATRGSLLRAMTKHDTPRPVTTTTRKSDGAALNYGRFSADAVDTLVVNAARRANLVDPEQYSGHSLRAGFASQAAADGIPLSIWAEHGRWSKTSPVPLAYVRAADAKRDNPLRKMGL